MLAAAASIRLRRPMWCPLIPDSFNQSCKARLATPGRQRIKILRRGNLLFRQCFPIRRIDRPTVNAHLVVQVRAAHEARRANGTDAVTGLDPRAFPNIFGNLGQMGIAVTTPPPWSMSMVRP